MKASVFDPEEYEMVISVMFVANDFMFVFNLGENYDL